MCHIVSVKRCLSFLLIWGILCSLSVFPSVQAAGRSPEVGQYFYGQLSAANQEAYDAISQQIEKLAADSTDPSAVAFTPTQGDPTDAAIFAFFRDHPEYFWVDSSKLVWSVSDSNVWSLSAKETGSSFFYEGFDTDTLPAVRAAFQQKVAEIIQGMPANQSMVAKLRYLNNWIAQHNVYNPLGIGASNYSRCAASGILSNNDEATAPVCYGYATALKVLLDAAGIRNAYIEGWAYNQNNWPNGEQHAWNYVEDNGNWYAIDPTWDDPKLTTGQARFHYFMVGSETVTETSLTGREKFGQNHDASASKTPASAYSLSYPVLSAAASDQVVTTGFELIYGDTSTKYDTLEEALGAAQPGSTVKLWQPATVTGTLSIPDGVTLDLNGQNSGTTLNPMAISGDISPLFSVGAGARASIVNSSSFTAINTTNTGACIQNDGALYLGTNLKIARGKPVMGGDPLSSPIGGNTPEYASNGYAALNANSPHLLFVYLVVQPTVSGSGSYQAGAGQTVQDLVNNYVNFPVPTIQYYGATGTLQNVPSDAVGPLRWSVGRSPNDGNRVSPTDPLENGDYLFVTTAFSYPITYTVTVSGVPDLPKEYTVTVHGGNGATGGGTYRANDPVTVTAGTKEGEIFRDWTAQGITLADATRPEISFAMPENDVTLTANFEPDHTIAVTGVALEPKVYDGTAAATVMKVDFSGLANGEQLILGTDYTAAAVFDSPAAGTDKTVSVTVNLTKDPYVFADGSKTATYTLSGQSIEKAVYAGVVAVSGKVQANTAGQVELPQPPDGAVFGAPVCSDAAAVTGMQITGNTLFYQGGSSVAGNQVYTVTIPVSGGGNYNDYQITVTLIGSDKQVLAVTGVSAYNGTYTGAAQTGYTGQPAAAGFEGEFTVTYNTANGQAPVNAGTYTVTFAIPDHDPLYTGSMTLEFTIAKKPLSVAVPALSVYVGDSVPALSVVYTGLLNGESVTPSEPPVFRVTKADGAEIALADAVKAAGVYTITWTNAENTAFAGADNYQVTKNAVGSLNVSVRPGSGDGSAQTPAPTPTPTPAPTPASKPANTSNSAGGARPSANSGASTTAGSTPVPTTAQVEAVLENGTSVAALSQDQFAQIVSQAVERARKSQGIPVLKLEVTDAEGAQILQVTLPGKALDTLSQQKGAAITVDSAVAEVAFDNEALKAIAEQAEDDVVLVINRAAELNEAQAAVAGNFPVLELTLQSNGVVISDFKQGNATVTVPYTLAEGQRAQGIAVWYMDEAGNTTVCETSYDVTSGKVTFRTPHFSKYVIAYEETQLPAESEVPESQLSQPSEKPEQQTEPETSGSVPVLPILGGVALALLVILAAAFGLRHYFLKRRGQ